MKVDDESCDEGCGEGCGEGVMKVWWKCDEGVMKVVVKVIDLMTD